MSDVLSATTQQNRPVKHDRQREKKHASPPNNSCGKKCNVCFPMDKRARVVDVLYFTCRKWNDYLFNWLGEATR